jgi:hypothetical protein
MACKEMAVVIPVVVMAYDRVFLSRDNGSRLGHRAAFYTGLFATWVVLLACLVEFSDVATRQGARHPIGSWDYLKTQAGVIVHYLRLALWPVGQASDYYDWPVAHGLSSVLPQAAVLLVLLAATAVALLRRAWLGFVGAWFFVILAPTSSVVPLGTEIAAERRMYLPLAAVVIVLLAGGWWVVRRCQAGVNRPINWIVAATVASLACVLIVLNVARTAVYQSNTTYWQAAVDQRPNNPRATYNLGIAIALESGPPAQGKRSLELYQHALDLDPTYDLARRHLQAERPR